MPSNLHETLVGMFRFRPSLAADLLAGALGVEVPAHQQVQLGSADLTDLVPTEYRADAVVVLTEQDRPVLGVVVEIQLGRDQGKRWSWPVYVTTLRARLRCPTELLVVCPAAAVARWSAGAIEVGLSGSRVVPLVLGPELVPVVTDPARAGAAPELAVLSALAHGADPHRGVVLDVLLPALASVDEDQAFLYLEVVYDALPAAARRHLEALMSTQTDGQLSALAQWFEARGEARGKAQGQAQAVLLVLASRGVSIPDEARDRIIACTDPVQLDTWVRRAATADTVDDLTG